MEVSEPDLRRKPTRLRNFDYRSHAAYHCTLVAAERRCIFSNIVAGQVHLTPLGSILDRCLIQLPDRFPDLQLDCFVIMPNHIHALFLLLNGQAPGWPERKRGTAAGSISSIIQAYKSTTSRLAKPLGYVDYWQRGFNDHIIRDEDDLFNVRRYILENPMKWELDLDNPVNWKK